MSASQYFGISSVFGAPQPGKAEDTMSINSIGGPHGANTSSSKTAANQGSSGPEKSSSQGSSNSSSTVSVTEPTIKLLELEQKIADMPSFDAAKVDNIKQAMREGSYTIIDAESLAKKMITFEQGLNQV